jgi:hypothetical protein
VMNTRFFSARVSARAGDTSPFCAVSQYNIA